MFKYVVTDGCIKLNGSTYVFCRLDLDVSITTEDASRKLVLFYLFYFDQRQYNSAQFILRKNHGEDTIV
jgi:hypothetical protein